MDEYIYSLPPPPPPSASAPSSSSAPQVSDKKRPLWEDSNEPASKHAKTSTTDDPIDEALIQKVRLASKNIDEWILERKKNWPTSKRVQEKQEKQEELKSVPGAKEENQADSAVKSQLSQHRKKPCKFFAAYGNCRNGDRCHFAHVKTYKRFEQPTRTSLFKRLVQSNMNSTENERILDYIIWLDDNKLLNP